LTTTVQTHPLISIRSQSTVQEAARLMADRSIGALGVLGGDKEFVGIITGAISPGSSPRPRILKTQPSARSSTTSRSSWTVRSMTRMRSSA
jgi:CBS-domain-containing membrane protein